MHDNFLYCNPILMSNSNFKEETIEISSNETTGHFMRKANYTLLQLYQSNYINIWL